MNQYRLIGIGGCGSNIVKEFHDYGNVYSTVSIDTVIYDDIQEGVRLHEETNDGVPAHQKYEEYGYKWDDLENGLENIQIFVSGASDVSGVILSVLEHLHKKKCKIQLFYIKPELRFLSELQKMQDKVSFAILQEYARSGLIDEMIILDNAILGQIVGKTTIANYFATINQKIAEFVHTFNFCNKNEPIFGQKNNFLETTRIGTLGYGSIDSDINLFYDLKSIDGEIIFPLEVQYYFLAPKEKIQNDENLMTKLLKTVEKEEEKYKSISYGVYEISSEQETTSVLVYLRTSKIQQSKNNNTEKHK